MRGADSFRPFPPAPQRRVHAPLRRERRREKLPSPGRWGLVGGRPRLDRPHSCGRLLLPPSAAVPLSGHAPREHRVPEAASDRCCRRHGGHAGHHVRFEQGRPRVLGRPAWARHRRGLRSRAVRRREAAIGLRPPVAPAERQARDLGRSHLRLGRSERGARVLAAGREGAELRLRRPQGDAGKVPLAQARSREAARGRRDRGPSATSRRLRSQDPAATAICFYIHFQSMRSTGRS
mmetsp:Transcript_71353/g.206911  ORF Transcript_71353/g.206911 Transcript_71353/m.206911 type:complete len:235 (+) Transcript_71353:886-1590(+)